MGGKYYFWHFAFLNQSEDGSDYETEFTIIVSRIDDDKLPISSVVNTILYQEGSMSGTKGKELYAPYQEEGETHRAARPPTYPKPEKGTGRFSFFNSSTYASASAEAYDILLHRIPM
jgi:hypothetical protein